MQSLKRLYQWIIRVEEALAGALMVAIAVLVFAAAIARFVGRPWNWAMDMSTFLFAWAVFLAADASMRNDRHPNVDLFVKKLPKKPGYIELLNYVLIAAFLVCLIYYGIVMSYHAQVQSDQGIPGFSYTWAP